MRIILLFTMLVGLLGCESPPVRRSQLIDEHPEWRSETIKVIKEGFIVKGMSVQQVRAAWGRPCWTCTGTIKYETVDNWRSWEYSTQVVFFDKAGKVTRWSKK